MNSSWGFANIEDGRKTRGGSMVFGSGTLPRTLVMKCMFRVGELIVFFEILRCEVGAVTAAGWIKTIGAQRG